MTEATDRQTRGLGDRYVLSELVGRGGMADVHRAHDQVLGRDVAVKVLRDTSPDPSARARFIDEARTLARLTHPGLVTLLDAGISGDRPYLVMELVEHRTLGECCAGRALAPERVAALGSQLADALAYVHETGVVHRDVKPGNVMLTSDNRCLLTDFGIAKLMGEATAGHTASGFTMGTAAYLAPEQVRGAAVGTATDVYSLGLVLLEALTGQRAYNGSPTEAALARLSVTPAIPADLAPAWTRLLRQMTDLEPSERPGAAEVAAHLSRLAGAQSATDATAVLRNVTRPMTTPVSSPESVPAVTPAGRLPLTSVQRSVVAAAAVIAFLLLALLMGLTGGDGDAPATDIPPDLPPGIAENLQDLHDAVNG